MCVCVYVSVCVCLRLGVRIVGLLITVFIPAKLPVYWGLLSEMLGYFNIKLIVGMSLLKEGGSTTNRPEEHTHTHTHTLLICPDKHGN